MSAQDISRAALKLFAEKGYDATTLADIAKVIGIKKPSIYAHYTSKMEIFLTVLHDVRIDYLQCWEKAVRETAGLSANEKLRNIFLLVGNYFFHHRDEMYFWMRMWMFPPTACNEDILRLMQDTNRKLISRIANIFQDGINEGIFVNESSLELSHAYWCMLDGYLVRMMCHPKFDYDKALSIIWKAFLVNSLQKKR
ncbi:TetR/AcrR family transcriptional regulator [Pectinatus sottacetonis]|uniref:TetR/AcrR family transcriptional regulator n=1 Tax=Pectinatus sottacetonis TaxID=1002795 RepID=UPI0018C4E7F9